MKNLTTKLAATLFILSGCAQNELIDSPNQGTPNDGRIRFAATSALTSTRAADGNPFNNTSNLQALGEFTVNGYLNGTSVYGATAQTVKWDSGSWEYANEPYWPSGDVKINFFAYANWPTGDAGTVNATIASTGITVAAKSGNITIGEDKLDKTGQKDLLVGGQIGATKQSRTLITFKHALTQIVFKAGNVNPGRLDVRIGGVRIVNVDNAASKMTFDGTAINWNLSGTKTAQYHVQGLETETSWSLDAGTWNTNLNVNADKVFTAPTDATLGDYSKYQVIQKTAGVKNNALLLLPQTFAAWNPNENATPTTGSYIELLAVVKDPTNASADKLAAADKQEAIDALKPYYYCGTPNYNADGNTESYGIIRIPLSSVSGDLGEWIAGKRITYLITFGDSDSGSGGGGYNPGGDPILVPIRFNAIVENWVDVNVPLLTATFNAQSDAVKADFINGYTNQLVNDIKSARVPKVYKSSVAITGKLDQTTKDDIALTFTDFTTNNMLVGSTVTYDFTGIDLWNRKITLTAPTGWTAKYYKNTTEVVDSPILNGTSANKVILTKTAESITAYSTTPEYISDFISAIRINEGTAVREAGWTITVKGTLNKDITFSADELAILGGVTDKSPITIDIKGLDFDSKKVSVIVPASWKATCGSTIKYAGEKLEVGIADNKIIFTKL